MDLAREATGGVEDMSLNIEQVITPVVALAPNLDRGQWPDLTRIDQTFRHLERWRGPILVMHRQPGTGGLGSTNRVAIGFSSTTTFGA